MQAIPAFDPFEHGHSGLLRRAPLTGTRGPCITSPYQIELANSALKLRFASGK